MIAETFVIRERALGHAIQTAVAYEMARGRSAETEPKHLRVGVNMAMCQHAALTRLLVNKGIIAEEDYFDLQIELLELELASYKERNPGIDFI